VVSGLLAARPDGIVMEVGLRVWRPPASVYIATYGAARTNGRAAAEILGLIKPMRAR
jgi:beta-N-acetylhexosaminidase